MHIPNIVKGMLPSGLCAGLYLTEVGWGGAEEKVATGEPFWKEGGAGDDEASPSLESISVKWNSVNTYKWKWWK